MFGLKKKKQEKAYKPIHEYGDMWAVGKGDLKGKPAFVRFRQNLKDAAGHPGFPFQIGVAIPLLFPDEYGFPGRQEADQLAEIEEGLDKALTAEGCVFALVLSTGGMREWVFYAPKWEPQHYDKIVHEVGDRQTTHKVTYMMQRDPTWNTYRFLTGEEI